MSDKKRAPIIYGVLGAALLGVQIATLHHFGQPFAALERRFNYP